MNYILEILNRLEWWQRPLLVLLPFLLLALAGPALYQTLVRLPLNIARGQFPKENRSTGWSHSVYGVGLLLIAGGISWAAYAIQVDLLGGHSHLVALGAVMVGLYELLYGLGILAFRTGALGVLVGLYAFIGFCCYGLFHWTLAWV